MYIGWYVASASTALVQCETSERTPKKNPNYNIANFDAIKLPELEVCFYTVRL